MCCVCSFYPLHMQSNPSYTSTGMRSNSQRGLENNDELQVLNSSVARLEGRMGKLEAIVEKKMDAILSMIQLQQQQQQQGTPRLQESRAPREP